MLERLVKICRASQVKKVQPGGVLREAMTIEKRYTFRLKESGVADYCRCGGPAVPAFGPFCLHFGLFVLGRHAILSGKFIKEGDIAVGQYRFDRQAAGRVITRTSANGSSGWTVGAHAHQSDQHRDGMHLLSWRDG